MNIWRIDEFEYDLQKKHSREGEFFSFFDWKKIIEFFTIDGAVQNLSATHPWKRNLFEGSRCLQSYLNACVFVLCIRYLHKWQFANQRYHRSLQHVALPVWWRMRNTDFFAILLFLATSLALHIGTVLVDCSLKVITWETTLEVWTPEYRGAPQHYRSCKFLVSSKHHVSEISPERVIPIILFFIFFSDRNIRKASDADD